MAWVDLSGAFGYGTKLTSTQVQNLRDNIAAAFAKAGGAPVLANLYVVKAMMGNNSIDSAHYVDASIDEGHLANSAVAQAKLKTSTHEQTTTSDSWQTKTLTYADYGFNCRVHGTGANVGHFARCDQTNYTAIAGDTYTGETVYLKTSLSGQAAYVIYRYVTASGEVFWIWILRNKLTKTIISMDVASDHCSFGLPDPSLRPHPFEHEYDSAKHEIILINPDQKALKQMYEKKGDRDLIETVINEYEIDESSDPAWPSVAITTRIKNADWLERFLTQKPVDIEKKVIPKVDYVLCKSLKAKSGKVL